MPVDTSRVIGKSLLIYCLWSLRLVVVCFQGSKVEKKGDNTRPQP
jgi:hypothetical protein